VPVPVSDAANAVQLARPDVEPVPTGEIWTRLTIFSSLVLMEERLGARLTVRISDVPVRT
jgi:hypothetical protein